MGISKNILKKIVQYVREVTNPDRIILFGSAATDRMGSDSDIDLLILKEKISNPRDESFKIRRQLNGLDYPFDIVVMSSDWYDRTKDLVGGLAYPAHKYGKVIYARSQK